MPATWCRIGLPPDEHKVQRHVPQLPYTTEIEAFNRLKRQLAAYRVVFGQPRQEELLTLLDQSVFDTAQLRDWAIDLAPPAIENTKRVSRSRVAGFWTLATATSLYGRGLEA